MHPFGRWASTLCLWDSFSTQTLEDNHFELKNRKIFNKKKWKNNSFNNKSMTSNPANPLAWTGMASYLSKSMPLVERVLAGPKTYAEIVNVYNVSCLQCFCTFLALTCCHFVLNLLLRTFFHLFLRVSLLSLVAEAQGPEWHVSTLRPRWTLDLGKITSHHLKSCHFKNHLSHTALEKV